MPFRTTLLNTPPHRHGLHHRNYTTRNTRPHHHIVSPLQKRCCCFRPSFSCFLAARSFTTSPALVKTRPLHGQAPKSPTWGITSLISSWPSRRTRCSHRLSAGGYLWLYVHCPPPQLRSLEGVRARRPLTTSAMESRIRLSRRRHCQTT